MSLAPPTTPSPPPPPPPPRGNRAAAHARTVKVPARVEPDRFSRPLRRLVFGGALVVLLALIPVLAWLGARAALDEGSRRGTTGPTDASAPGYQALVTPTPTLLLLGEGAEGSLATVTLLAAGGEGGRGGGVLFVPTRLLVEPNGDSSQPLSEVYAAKGAEATAAALRQLLRTGFDRTVTVDAARWAQLLSPIAPLSFDNSDDVTRAVAGGQSGVVFRAGRLSLEPEDVSSYLELRNPGEAEGAHLYRHELFWRAWLAAVAARGDDAAVPGEVGSGLGGMVRELAAGGVRYATLPAEATEPLTGGTGLFDHRLDAEAAATVLSEVVPFPRSGEPGDRIKVRLLDGLGDRQLALGASAVLVPAGAEVTLFGNADHFDYETTEVRYYNPARQADAAALAEALGAGEPVLQEDQTDTVDVTVIVGRDLGSGGGSELSRPCPPPPWSWPGRRPEPPTTSWGGTPSSSTSATCWPSLTCS
jgi:hypothetical protein